MELDESILMFKEEARGLINNIEENIIKFEKDPTNLKSVEDLYFVFNGLSSLISMLNMANIANFCRQVEKSLEKIKSKKLSDNKVEDFLNFMFSNLSVLQKFYDNILKGEIEDILPQELEFLHQKLDDFEREYQITFIEPIPYEKISSTIVGKSCYNILIRIKESCKFKKVRLFFIFRALNNVGKILYSIPEPSKLENGDFEFEFEVFFISEETEFEINKILDEILEIENKFIKKIEKEKFKTIIQDFSQEIQEKNAEINKKLEEKETQAINDGDITSLITRIIPEEVEEIQKDRTKIFYKIYVRVKLKCKFMKLRLFLVLRTLKSHGEIHWTIPPPSTLEKGDIGLDFEVYYVSKLKKNMIIDNIEKVKDIVNISIIEINPLDYKKIISKFIPKTEIKQVGTQVSDVSSKTNEKFGLVQENHLNSLKVNNIGILHNEPMTHDNSKAPMIIYTDSIFSVSNKIFLPNTQFIDLILHEKRETVFCCSKQIDTLEFYLYVVKDGVFFVTSASENNDVFKEFFNIYEGGFSSFIEFLDSRKYGIETSFDYIRFKKSDFYSSDINSYKKYLETQKY